MNEIKFKPTSAYINNLFCEYLIVNHKKGVDFIELNHPKRKLTGEEITNKLLNYYGGQYEHFDCFYKNTLQGFEENIKKEELRLNRMKFALKIARKKNKVVVKNE